jgi:glutamine synthetase
VSLVDDAGRNVFAADDPAGSPLLRQAIGGLAATINDAMAVCAPTANSYGRFQPEAYVPLNPSWSVNNRGVAFRVPHGPPASRRVEHRVAGADANPYLVAALVLAAMLKGIEERIDPGPPVTGNGYEQAPRGELPTHWQAALERAAGSSFLEQALGRGFLEVFLAVKRAECEKFGALVSDRDYEWYLEQA